MLPSYDNQANFSQQIDFGLADWVIKQQQKEIDFYAGQAQINNMTFGAYTERLFYGLPIHCSDTVVALTRTFEDDDQCNIYGAAALFGIPESIMTEVWDLPADQSMEVIDQWFQTISTDLN